MFRLAPAAVVVWAVACACGSKRSSTPDAAPSIPVADAPAREAEEADDIQPVYPVDDQPPSPLAVRLCQALHDLPARKKAECCGGQPAPTLASECARTLSYALRVEAVAVDEAKVAACEQAMTRTHEGCVWVGPLSRGFPVECRGLIGGTLAAGAKCRSSMECQAGLRCRGAGPTEPGVCGPPLADGARCSISVDTLISYTRQEAWAEETHRECTGFCIRRACRPVVPEGAECRVTAECGPGRRCAHQGKTAKCASGGLAKEGEACSADECEPGLRCWQNRCIRPKPAGQACKTSFECKGGCVDKKCAMQCGVMPRKTP